MATRLSMALKYTFVNIQNLSVELIRIGAKGLDYSGLW
jgi:hypothetical protein